MDSLLATRPSSCITLGKSLHLFLVSSPCERRALDFVSAESLHRNLEETLDLEPQHSEINMLLYNHRRYCASKTLLLKADHIGLMRCLQALGSLRSCWSGDVHSWIGRSIHIDFPVIQLFTFFPFLDCVNRNVL